MRAFKYKDIAIMVMSFLLFIADHGVSSVVDGQLLSNLTDLFDIYADKWLFRQCFYA